MKKKKSLSNHSQPLHHAYAQFMQKRKWKAFKGFGVSSDTMQCRKRNMTDITHLCGLCVCLRAMYKFIHSHLSIIHWRLSSLFIHKMRAGFTCVAGSFSSGGYGTILMFTAIGCAMWFTEIDSKSVFTTVHASAQRHKNCLYSVQLNCIFTVIYF